MNHSRPVALYAIDRASGLARFTPCEPVGGFGYDVDGLRGTVTFTIDGLWGALGSHTMAPVVAHHVRTLVEAAASAEEIEAALLTLGASHLARDTEAAA